MDLDNKIYNPFNAMEFDDNHCFLCGTLLNETNKSDEHFFPKWLLNKYDLWNQNIYLQNNTQIKYKALKIPCCKKCNNEKLNNIENIILNAVEKGYDEFIKIDETIIFQWTAKIYYSFIFKELFLKKDIKSNISEPIFNEQQLSRFKSLHILLQSIIKPFKFIGDKPWSLFIFKMQHLNNKYDFDYHDSTNVPAFTIRMNDIGIAACFGDFNQVYKILHSRYDLTKGHELHPIQLTEFFTEIIYTVLTLNYDPFSLFISDKDNNITVASAGSVQHYLDPKNDLLFAKIFARYLRKWGINFEMLYNIEHGTCCTYLNNVKGEFYKMNYKKDFEKLKELYGI